VTGENDWHVTRELSHLPDREVLLCDDVEVLDDHALTLGKAVAAEIGCDDGAASRDDRLGVALIPTGVIAESVRQQDHPGRCVGRPPTIVKGAQTARVLADSLLHRISLLPDSKAAASSKLYKGGTYWIRDFEVNRCRLIVR
jgi:hypothetical protein